MRPFDPRVFQALPEARPVMAGLGVVGVAQGLLAVAQALAVSRLVVAVVRSGTAQAPDLHVAMLLVVLVFALRAALAAFAETYAARAGIRVSGLVRERLLARWLAAPAESRPDPAIASTLATQGCTSIEPYVARFLPALVGAVVLPVVAIATIAVLDWVSALIVVLTVPLLPIFAALFGRATADSTERRWRALTALSGHFLDVVRGLPTLVTYGRAQRQSESIRSVSQAHRAATVRTLRIAFLSSAALELLATISVAIVAVTVGLRLTNGDMDLVPGLTCILLAPEAFWPIRRVGAEYHAAADGVAALGAALDELAAPAAPAAGAHRIYGVGDVEAIHGIGRGGRGGRVEGLSYRYPGTEALVLDRVDLAVPAAGLVAVTGPSGAGKSTLLELLAGLRTPTAGLVAVPSAHLVGQRPLLVAGSLRDNLTLGVPTDPGDESLWAVLDEVGLAADVRALPEGLQTPLGDDGFGLSAGQRARLALARALLSDAPLVLLDEPTAHLDPESARLAHAAIAGLADDRAVVAVTHRPELVELADAHVVVGRSAAPSGELAGGGER